MCRFTSALAYSLKLSLKRPDADSCLSYGHRDYILSGVATTERRGRALAEPTLSSQPYAGPVTDFPLPVLGPTCSCTGDGPARRTEKIGATRHKAAKCINVQVQDGRSVSVPYCFLG